MEEDERELEQKKTFTTLQQRLKTLNERRRQAKERVERCQALRNLLDPFADPEENVQANLITKGGEVERELERMKMLLLRVERGVGGLGGLGGLGERRRRVDGEEGDGMEGLEWEEGQDGDGDGDGKVLRLLGAVR